MYYFIFSNNLDNVGGTIYRIAENESDLNNLNLNKEIYKIIEESSENFNLTKLGYKYPLKYNNNSITFIDEIFNYRNKEELKKDINSYLILIKNFIKNNTNHPLYNQWNDYYNQLNNLDLDTITYPLNKSLQQYFSDLNKPYYSILQIP
jgi:hypothetical protein